MGTYAAAVIVEEMALRLGSEAVRGALELRVVSDVRERSETSVMLQ